MTSNFKPALIATLPTLGPNMVGSFMVLNTTRSESHRAWIIHIEYLCRTYNPDTREVHGKEIQSNISKEGLRTEHSWYVYNSRKSNKSGARLTKAYDVTIQRYRKSHVKYKTVKCIFCGVWVQNFVWNFKGHLWNFTQNFDPIHRKISIIRGGRNLTTYAILELWHLKS